MPLIKKGEVMPERPIVVVIYGQPGVAKTSLSNTANNPILLDCDRGSDRSLNPPDTLIAQRWEDILQDEAVIKDYKTVLIDTAKAVLDDYLWDYCVRTDRTLVAKNGKTIDMKVYGAIGKEFKQFINKRRSEGLDIVIIAHAKEEKDQNITKIFPDVTGSSKDLLLRIADQVGYLSMINGNRVLSFDPMDGVIGKNTANIAPIQIPDASNPAFATMMDEIIKGVKKSIQTKNAMQNEFQKSIEEIKVAIDRAENAEDANILIETLNSLPPAHSKALKLALMKQMKGKAEINKSTKLFEDVPN